TIDSTGYHRCDRRPGWSGCFQHSVGRIRDDPQSANQAALKLNACNQAAARIASPRQMLVRAVFAILLAAICRVSAQEAFTDALPSPADATAEAPMEQPVPESAWLDLRQNPPQNKKRRTFPPGLKPCLSCQLKRRKSLP